MTNEQRWAERVAAWRASGLSSTEFCAGRDFTPGGLRHWSHLLKKRGARKAPAAVMVAPTVRMVRVTVAAQKVDVSSPSATLTVELGPARVMVPGGVDAKTVEVVLAALCRHAVGGAR